MSNLRAALVASLVTLAIAPWSFASDRDQAAEFLHRNCLDCHDGAGAEAGLDLRTLRDDLSDTGAFAKWVRVVDRVRDGEMPPPESSTINDDQRRSFVDLASDRLASHQLHQFETVGRVPLRRLTHAQVERSLHDLLAIDLPLATRVPADPRIDGYTTIADGQPMSHFQLQSHLTIVDAALDEAFSRASEDPHAKPRERSLDARELSRENPRRRCREPEVIDGRGVVWSSTLIFYGRIPATTAREDGWYEFKISVSAINKPKQHGVWCSVRSGECTSGAPLLSWIGGFEADDETQEVSFTAWLPEGHMIEVRPADSTLKMAKFAGGQVGSGEGAPQRVPGVAIKKIEMKRIHPGGSVMQVRQNLLGDCFDLISDSSERFESAESRAQIDRQIGVFASRAFRRPASDEQTQAYASIFHGLLASGESASESLKSCYRAVLCSPRFIYFHENVGKLDDFAIASRLSYFLAGSMPDDELIRVASEGRLHDRVELARQVDRLLATPRGETFVARFTDEWLDLVDINFTEPDRKLYRDFDQVVENAMLAETRTYVADMLARNASVAEFIDSKHSFANSRLARFYELSEHVDQDDIERVRLSAEDQRGGLMSQGAILKVTANGTNTSPVLRGVWLARRLLGETIPPPPAGVAAIEPDIRGATTIREQLERHRDDENCASCHRKIDPAGFALERFDPAGQLRTKYLAMRGGKLTPTNSIDTSYVMADGRKFDDFDEFQELLLTDLRPVARNFVEQLLTFGTGAAPTFADREAITSLVDASAGENYGVKSLLVSAVTSPIFLRK